MSRMNSDHTLACFKRNDDDGRWDCIQDVVLNTVNGSIPIRRGDWFYSGKAVICGVDLGEALDEMLLHRLAAQAMDEKRRE